MSKSGPSKPLRLLAPAPALHPSSSSGRSAGDTVSSENVIAPRRMLVKNACSNCKVKKTKCDGKRPRCTRCDTRKLECVFETLYEGMTKQESAEFEIVRLQGIITDLNAKFHVLKHGSHDQAQSMLASIRQQVQDHEDDDEWSRLPDPLQILPASASLRIDQACTSSSSESSDVFKEHEFLPLLFNRREWTRGPSSNDDDTNTEFFAVPGIENLEQSIDQLPTGLENGLTPRQSNNFKNLPFSSAILANHFPPDIQQQQYANVFQPLWSILPLATLPGAQSVKDSVSNTIQQARLLIQSGQSLDQVAGKSCNIGAILDHDQYNRTTLLSQWAARIVFSVQRRSPEFVAFASMHMAWLLARWMIDPKQETFLALPEWFRPTISQLYIPHVDLVDFLLWPSLRDMITNRPDTLQKDWRWLDDMSRTIECDWFINVDLALETNPGTGEVHLTETAKACAEGIENWSVGSSVRQYLDADSTIKIRPNYH